MTRLHACEMHISTGPLVDRLSWVRTYDALAVALRHIALRKERIILFDDAGEVAGSLGLDTNTVTSVTKSQLGDLFSQSVRRVAFPPGEQLEKHMSRFVYRCQYVTTANQCERDAKHIEVSLHDTSTLDEVAVRISQALGLRAGDYPALDDELTIFASHARNHVAWRVHIEDLLKWDATHEARHELWAMLESVAESLDKNLHLGFGSELVDFPGVAPVSLQFVTPYALADPCSDRS